MVCAICKGVNVQVMDWVDANLETLVGGNDQPAHSEQWCEDCDRNTDVISVEMTPELQAKIDARRKT